MKHFSNHINNFSKLCNLIKFKYDFYVVQENNTNKENKKKN